jgi:adenosylhomocysteine nucleosidase
LNKPLLGFVVALPTEWKYFRAAFSGIHRSRGAGFNGYRGAFGELDCLVAIAGAGKGNARTAAQNLVEQQAAVLISLGFAGALSPQLVRGDIVLSAYSSAGLSSTAGDWEKYLEQQLFSAADSSHEHHVYVSPLHTADRIIARQEEKKQLYLETNAGIVDMESHAISKAARENGLPFVGIHAVSDTADEDIPALEVIAPFLASKSVWRYGRLFLDLLRRPRLIMDLASLSHDAKVAGRQLTHFLRVNQLALCNIFRICSIAYQRPEQRDRSNTPSRKLS